MHPAKWWLEGSNECRLLNSSMLEIARDSGLRAATTAFSLLAAVGRGGSAVVMARIFAFANANIRMFFFLLFACPNIKKIFAFAFVNIRNKHSFFFFTPEVHKVINSILISLFHNAMAAYDSVQHTRTCRFYIEIYCVSCANLCLCQLTHSVHVRVGSRPASWKHKKFNWIQNSIKLFMAELLQ